MGGGDMYMSLMRHAFLGLVVALVLGAAGRSSATDEVATPESPEARFIPPQIILESQKPPVYPPAALAARYTGSVVVELNIQSDGTVGQPKVVQCTRPNVGFEAAAIEAVKQWRFVPATNDGEPAEVSTRIQLNFTGHGGRMLVVAGVAGQQGWNRAAGEGKSDPGGNSHPGDRK